MKPIEQLTDEEMNREIAEFMGHSDVEFLKGKMHYKDICSLAQPRKHYTESLDSLVSAWEKLELVTDFKINLARPLTKWRWGFMLLNFTGSISFNAFSETIQKAAAIATLKAIRELVVKDEN